MGRDDQPDAEPLRSSRGDRIHPQTIYRYGWGVVDGESTFAPPAFLDLYALSRESPRLLDLLNVRYVLPAGAAPPPPAKVTGPLRVWPGALRRLPLPGEGAARQIEIQSHLVHGLEIPQGQTVATLRVLAADGTVAVIPLRAGIETAEWAVDRPGARAGHGKPAVSPVLVRPGGLPGPHLPGGSGLAPGIPARPAPPRGWTGARPAGRGALGH